jgi:SAM-dependent methyltransferase
MSDGDLERLERERQNADRQYNDALTAFDGAFVRATPAPDLAVTADAAPPALPAGWQGRWLRVTDEWLRPWIERQQAFNARTVALVDELVSRERERTAAFERFQSALIVFLQQITPFVETKDRQLAATARVEFEGHQRQLEDLKEQLRNNLPDLHAQIAVLQRIAHTLTRERAAPAAQRPAADVGAAGEGDAGGVASQADDYKYVGFEDQFRGSTEEIGARLAEYLPLFEGASDVLDVGCGRGEFLARLESAGISARGVDVNAEMVATAHERRLDAVCGDALAYLTSVPDATLGGLFAAQVAEHLEPSYLIRLLETAFHKLRPAAPLVIETINPTCWLAFFSSYLRDFTHVQPIHPDTLAYLVRASGFTRVSVRYSAPVPEHTRMALIEVPAEVGTSTEPMARALGDAARVLNRNADILNQQAFSFQDYAVIGYRS